MKIKLWLDDCRRAPNGWLHVKTAAAAIDVLRSGSVEAVSLDHDLGASEKRRVGTGYDVATWLEANPSYLPERFSVHSANPIGARKMLVALQNALRKKEGAER